MDFLGIGPGELVVILVIALVVFGPGKLPEIGATLGRAVRDLRKASNQFTQEFQRGLEETPPTSAPKEEGQEKVVKEDRSR